MAAQTTATARMIPIATDPLMNSQFRRVALLAPAAAAAVASALSPGGGGANAGFVESEIAGDLAVGVDPRPICTGGAATADDGVELGFAGVAECWGGVREAGGPPTNRGLGGMGTADSVAVAWGVLAGGVWTFGGASESNSSNTSKAELLSV